MISRGGRDVVAISKGTTEITRITRDGVDYWVKPSTSGVEVVSVEDTVVGTGDLQWEYSAGWQVSVDEHYSGIAGSLTRFRFHGTGFVLRGTKDAHHGHMSVQIDDAAAVTADAYAPAREKDAALYTASSLTDGPHTITITVLSTKNASSGGNVVAINRMVATTTPSNGVPVLVEDTSLGTGELQWEYTAGWQVSTSEHYSSLTSANAILRFKGTAVTLRGSKDAHHGQMSVSIDGAAPTLVDCYAAVRESPADLLVVTGLVKGDHSVSVTPAGTKNASSTGTVIAINNATVLSTGLTAVPVPPADDTTTPTDSSVALYDDFTTHTGSWTSSSNDTSEEHPWLRFESGDPTVYISGGYLRLNALGKVYMRQISDMRFGGYQKKTRITFRARVNQMDSTSEISGTIPGMKLGAKFRCPDSSFPETDWQSVRGYNNASPGSFIFLNGLGAKGRLQLPRNRACVDGYEDGFFTKDIGYTLGTWVDRTILFEHVGTSTSDPTYRVRYWDNTTQSGTPFYDVTVEHPYVQVKPWYLWLRTDFVAGEYDWIKVEELSETTSATRPAKSTVALSTPTSTSVKIAWSIPSNGGSTITSHIVQRRTYDVNGVGGTWATIATPGGTATSYTDTTVTTDTKYGYKHASVNAVGTSDYSDEKTVTPAAAAAGISYMAPADSFTTAVSTGWRVVTAITVSADQASLSYADTSVLAGPLEDATGKTVSCEYVSHTAAAGCEATVGIRLDSSNYVVLRLAENNLKCRELVAGATSDVDLGTFSATTHRYWRVRHDSGTDEIVWETSADKTTWTERRRKIRGFAITSVYSRIGVYRFTGTNTGTFVVDNANS